jgi:hypothetical protein
MTEMPWDKIRETVEAWATGYFKTTEAVSHLFADEDDPERYIVVLALRGLDDWQAVEAWVEEEEVVAINALGEGVPPDGVAWPWAN